jgi:glycogen debranching enzyme
MKHGDSFLVLDTHGDIGASAGGPDGLFHSDTRYLSHLELLINGLQPLMLGSNLSNDNCVLTVDLTNPDMFEGDRIILRKSLLHVSRTIFVARDNLHQRFVVHNYGANKRSSAVVDYLRRRFCRFIRSPRIDATAARASAH